MFTVDASVFLNAFNDSELGHERSKRLLAVLGERSLPIIVPTLVLPEVAAVIGRAQGSAARARAFVSGLRRLPHLTFVPLDIGLAQEAVEFAADNRLRGSDAVYAAVALRYGSTLVTLDAEQRQRVSAAVPALRPEEALAALE